MVDDATWLKYAEIAWEQLANMKENEGKPHWKDLTPAQQEAFCRMFKEQSVQFKMGKINNDKER
jgi:hypothetical protein